VAEAQAAYHAAPAAVTENTAPAPPDANQPRVTAQESTPPADDAAPAAPGEENTAKAQAETPPPPNIPIPNTPRRRLVVTLESTGDAVRDKLRLRRIHGHIIAFPGKDAFAFYILERDQTYLIEFEETTQVCPELLSWLQDVVGAHNVRIEPL